ncbi:hypothetical protein QYM36_015944, partial [Artemia franciscana]
ELEDVGFSNRGKMRGSSRAHGGDRGCGGRGGCGMMVLVVAPQAIILVIRSYIDGTSNTWAYEIVQLSRRKPPVEVMSSRTSRDVSVVMSEELIQACVEGRGRGGGQGLPG